MRIGRSAGGRRIMGLATPVPPERRAELGLGPTATFSGPAWIPEPYAVEAIRGGQFQIGNNRGGINGWVTARAIYGRCTRVEP